MNHSGGSVEISEARADQSISVVGASPTSVVSFSSTNQQNSHPTHDSYNEGNNNPNKFSCYPSPLKEAPLLPTSQEMKRGPPTIEPLLDTDLNNCDCSSIQSEEAPPFAFEEVLISPSKDSDSCLFHSNSTQQSSAVNGSGCIDFGSIGDCDDAFKESMFGFFSNGSVRDASTKGYDFIEGIDGDDKQNRSDGELDSLSNLIHSGKTPDSEIDHYNSREDAQHQRSTILHKSVNFSRLMEQADDKEENLFAEEPSFLGISYEVIPSFSPSQENAIPEDERQSSTQRDSIMSLPMRSKPRLEDISLRSFRVAINTSFGVNLRDALDIVSNPELLINWNESINSLVVTDHKGGSPTSSIYTEQDQIQYDEPPLEEYDDDMILPPAQEKKIPSREPKREYDGEWVQASTSSIIPPRSHSNIFDDCVERVRDIMGFPSYGSVSMFIERNLHRVCFTVGPYKGGCTLSHKITLKEAESKEGGVTITDEVNLLMKGEDEEDFVTYLTCFEPLQELVSGWLSPGLDGYVTQTQQSLVNLVRLIERPTCYNLQNEGNLILSSCADGIREPLILK